MRRDIEAVENVSVWLTDNNPFNERRDLENLISFSSGLVSNRTDAVNANDVFDVGRIIQGNQMIRFLIQVLNSNPK